MVTGIACVLALGLAGELILAQVGGQRGIAPVAASTDIEVSGIKVDEQGDSPQDAREAGWRAAQRMAWEKIEGPDIPDSQLEGLVSAVVIERERIGPRRYLATLGVIFDRQRAGRLLGEEGRVTNSAPLLVIPVVLSGGTATTFEIRNVWQRAWADFQAGGSQIDYVRPSGFGAQSLLVNYGQATRRSRFWWRNVLDQFGATDVIMPIARLDYQYPGGPVQGQFTARYGPDSRYLASFTLNARNQDELPRMLLRAVRQFDQIYTRALNRGLLQPDPTLDIGTGEIDPDIQRLIEIGRQLRSVERDRAAPAQAPAAERPVATPDAALAQPAPPEAATTTIVVQFASPNPAAFDATLAAVRGVEGVRSVAVNSLAIGGTSVMRVTYAGSLEGLSAALSGRGFIVQQGGSSLTISR